MLKLRKVFEITGYADTENGCAYCLNCVDEEDLREMKDFDYNHIRKQLKLTPIFLGDEWDAPGPACDNCFELIEITPIV